MLFRVEMDAPVGYSFVNPAPIGKYSPMMAVQYTGFAFVLSGLVWASRPELGWLRKVAHLGGRSYEEMRVIVLEFLDTDIFHVSAGQCVAFLDPMIASWDVDLATDPDWLTPRNAASDPTCRFGTIIR